MYIIEIDEQRNDGQDMAELLRMVADMLDEGYTSGYYPYWELKKVDNVAGKKKEPSRGN